MRTVCLVTGCNTGIGRVTALEMARRGAHVLAACRSPEKGREAVDAIRRESGSDAVDLVALDLGSLASVRRAAEEVLARDLPLQLLINNAGVAGHRGVTKDGFELQFGTNHLGHFLLTKLLLPKLEASAPARIVNVASKAHYMAKGIDFDALRGPTRTFAGLREYEVSKLANVLFTAELARRLDRSKVTAYALHPGVVASDAWRRIPWPFRWWVTRNMISNEKGARTTLHCATAPELAAETGLYYDACRPKEPSPLAKDPALAKRLWERSEEWTA